MKSLGEQLQRCEDARKRAMKNLQRFTNAYLERQDGESYLALVEALAWAEAIRMEAQAVSSLAAQREVPFELSEDGAFAVEDAPRAQEGAA